MKAFPVDIFGVKKIGVEKWQDDFFWPVRDEEFFSLIDRIWNIFHEEMQKCSGALRDIIISNIGLIQQYGMFLHAVLVVERLKKAGHEVLLHEGTQYYLEILTGNLRDLPSQTEIGFAIRTKNCIKQMLKFFLKNQFSSANLRKRLADHMTAVSLGSFVSLKREYCNKNHLLVTHKSYLDFLKWAPPKDCPGIGIIDETIQNIVGSIERLVSQLGFSLESAHKACLAEVGKGPLYLSFALYQGILQGYTKKIDLLLLSEVAKPLNKTICFALKRKFNTRIVGFEHGNTFGSLLSRYFPANELAHCDEYVVSTPGSVSNFREAQRLAWLPYGTGTHISSVDTDYYRNLAGKNKTMNLPEKTRRVMLIGFPMNQNRYVDFPGHFSLFHLDLELRLINYLRRRGFIAIYKVHPERLREAEGIFEKTADEIMTAPFEEVYDACDTYLFAHTDSSTFGFAVCTNKPIVVIDIQGRPWKGDAYELLSKRCHMVLARIDEKCRILFDEVELEKALNRDIECPNMEYVEKMAAS